jgi:hypothetical protein
LNIGMIEAKPRSINNSPIFIQVLFLNYHFFFQSQRLLFLVFYCKIFLCLMLI